jgi:hypothetical protein
MASTPISDISKRISPSTFSVQTPLLDPDPETAAIVRIHGVASSIRPSNGSFSPIGRVIPVPSQVSASSSSTREEEKEFIQFIKETLSMEPRTSGEVDKELLKNVLPNGKGELSYVDGEGEFRDGKFHGQGICSSPNGTVYKGQFKDGKCHGDGTFTDPNKIVYVGEFQNGKFHGKGKLTYPNQDTYEGEFRENLFHGEGIYCFSNGKTYTGQFQNGKCHGHGTLRSPTELIYVGEFQNGKFHGKGKLIRSNGEVQEGRFENDQFIQRCCIQ